MSDDIVLISCVKKKADSPAPAKDLYQSEWFRKARAYAETIGDWYVLSAKYGLVQPDAVIDPYDTTLLRMTRAQRVQWAARVARQIDLAIPAARKLIVLGGERYREFLVLLLESAGYFCEVPMTRMGIGQQLQWLAAHTPERKVVRAERYGSALALFASATAGVPEERENFEWEIVLMATRMVLLKHRRFASGNKHALVDLCQMDVEETIAKYGLDQPPSGNFSVFFADVRTLLHEKKQLAGEVIQELREKGVRI